MESNSNLFSENTAKPPLIQTIVLSAILFGYPLISTALHYLNPPIERIIESRIIQIYMPALLIQSIIFFGILLVILKSTPITAGQCWGLSESFASIGIKRGDFTFINIVAGIIFLFAAIIVLNIISNIIDYYGIFQSEDITYLLPRTLFEKVFWVVLSIGAGITEEICFRGYVISRMTKLTGMIWPGVILGSISFGLGHLYQGFAGVTLITFYGVMFSLLFLARGSLVPCIVAHALQDIIAVFVN